MEWLKEIRDQKNKTQSEISDACQISQVAYSYIENGRRRPSVDVAKRIAAALEFDWTRVESLPPFAVVHWAGTRCRSSVIVWGERQIAFCDFD